VLYFVVADIVYKCHEFFFKSLGLSFVCKTFIFYPNYSNFVMKKTRSLLINLSLLVIVVLFFLFAFEIILRLLSIGGPGWAKGMLVADKDLCYKWNPNFSGYVRGSGFNTDLKINSAGFRDYEYSDLKNKKVIISIGDSMTGALQVSSNKTFTKLLEKKLGSTYAVLNHGVIGYNPSQYVVSLNQSIKKYNPKIVLLNFFVGNDFIKKESDFRVYPCASTVVEGYLVNSNWTSLSWFFKFRASVGYYSYFYNFISSIISSQYNLNKFLYGAGITKSAPYRDDLLVADENSNLNKEYYGATFSILKEIKELSRSNNATLIVVVLPSFDHIFPPYLNETINNYNLGKNFNFTFAYSSVEKYLDKENVLFLNFAPILIKNKEDTYGRFDKHLSVKGNQVVAQSLFEFLSKNKLV